jgi:hypothetical protein
MILAGRSLCTVTISAVSSVSVWAWARSDAISTTMDLGFAGRSKLFIMANTNVTTSNGPHIIVTNRDVGLGGSNYVMHTGYASGTMTSVRRTLVAVNDYFFNGDFRDLFAYYRVQTSSSSPWNHVINVVASSSTAPYQSFTYSTVGYVGTNCSGTTMSYYVGYTDYTRLFSMDLNNWSPTVSYTVQSSYYSSSACTFRKIQVVDDDFIYTFHGCRSVISQRSDLTLHDVLESRLFVFNLAVFDQRCIDR